MTNHVALIFQVLRCRPGLFLTYLADVNDACKIYSLMNSWATKR